VIQTCCVVVRKLVAKSGIQKMWQVVAKKTLGVAKRLSPKGAEIVSAKADEMASKQVPKCCPKEDQIAVPDGLPKNLDSVNFQKP